MRKQENRIPYEVRARRNRMRRIRQLRRRLTAGAALLSAVLFVLVFIMTGTMSDAREETGEVLCKCYRSVVILPGDRVDTLGRTYLTDRERLPITDDAAYAAEIRSINHLTDAEEPLAGDCLIIPYYDIVS